MTDHWKELMPYVKAKVESIFTSKSSKQIFPILASEPEILDGIREDLIQCMKELANTGSYRETLTLNHPALMKPN